MLGFSPLAATPLASGPLSGSSPTTIGPGSFPLSGGPFALVSQSVAEFTQTVLEVWVKVNTYNFAATHIGFSGGPFQLGQQFSGGHVTFTAGNFSVSQDIGFVNGHIVFSGAPFAIINSSAPKLFLWVQT